MYQKTFKNGHNPKRPIMVKVDNRFISFHFPYENDLEFYWIPMDEWKDTMREFIRQKQWFNSEMESFIDRCVTTITKSAEATTPSTTVEQIAGFHFYVVWKNDNEGTDQRGNKWTGRSNPQCLNQKVVDACLDAYNEVKKSMEHGFSS